MNLKKLRWILPLLLPLFLRADEDGPGEYSTRSTHPMTSEQLLRLRALIVEDPEARAIGDEIRAAALPRLDAVPVPLDVIHYEGLVNTDPRRLAAVEKLRTMDDVAAVLRYWQTSDDPRAADMLRRFVLAWSAVYIPTGNDVNENKLYPLFVAYDVLRSRFPPGERERVDAWMRVMGEKHRDAVATSRNFSNRYTKHVRLLSIIGRTLGEEEWSASAETAIRRFVSHSLRADGGSYDLERRDTLTYHNSALRPILDLAMTAGEKGRELYAWESPEGGSIRKSVHYVVPYAMGEKTREEWRNTQVDLDRRRAAAGLEAYRPGRLYDPKNALTLMEEASFFDESLLPVVRHLSPSGAQRFPSWQMLVNAAFQ